MSRASSASAGEVAERQQKANTVNQHKEAPINDSDRVFGMDGTSDRDGYNYRALSRSPSPYRRKRTRSRSPQPYRRHRTADRSPSPYRRNRRADRSPSPYRYNRVDQGYHGKDGRAQPKRKSSPPRANRPDKRHHADRSRPSEPRYRSHADGGRNGYHTGFVKERNSGVDRSHAKPISYAEIDKTNTVPAFQAAPPNNSQLKTSNRNDQPRDKNRQPPPRERQQSANGSKTQLSVSQDVKMMSVGTSQWLNHELTDHSTKPIVDDGPEYTLISEEKAPTQESRDEKRRRWAAIRAAAEQQKPKENLLHQAVLANASDATTPNVASPAPFMDSPFSPFGSPRNGEFGSLPASPDVMVIDKQGGISEGNSPSAASPSAADYNPLQDMLDDRNRAVKKTQNGELPSSAYHEIDSKVLSTLPSVKAIPVKKQREVDMFADSDDNDDADVDDITAHMNAKGTVLDEKLLDNWDDPEGYYKLISNELVNGERYQMIKALGRGVFANVAQAKDVSNPDEENVQLVAIKMIRRNELMRKASQKEMDFLRKVNEADPKDQRHIIRLLGSFDHKGHLCIVFEHMSKNLRDLLKEETNGHGLALPAVRTYAKQMFLGLHHLLSCQVIHLDLKPDNVLVSPDKKTIKLADFGTAVDKRDQIERTEYLVSRFYRAPEIILGMDIGYPVDMWAVGCTVYELWTGKILFTGRSNNQMIKAFMDCLGWPSEKLLKKGLVNNILTNFEIGPPLQFLSREVNSHSNKISIRKIQQQKTIQRDMKTRVHEAARGIANGPTVGELNALAELLISCLHMNVDKRITPKEALNHKFFGTKPPAPKPTTTAVVKPPMLKRGVPGTRR